MSEAEKKARRPRKAEQFAFRMPEDLAERFKLASQHIAGKPRSTVARKLVRKFVDGEVPGGWFPEKEPSDGD